MLFKKHVKRVNIGSCLEKAFEFEFIYFCIFFLYIFIILNFNSNLEIYNPESYILNKNFCHL